MFQTLKMLQKHAKSAAIIAAVATAPAIIAPCANAGETVELNKTHMIRLSQPASAVIVGDPAIADVSVHADNIIFLLGRGYGETDLLVLDPTGNVIMHTDISVTAPQSRNRVSIINAGVGRESYHCAPRCEASPVLGDDTAFIGSFSSNEAAISNGTATLSQSPDTASPQSGNGPSSQQGPTEY